MSISNRDGGELKPYRTMYKSRDGSAWLTHASADTEAEAWAVTVPGGAERIVVRLTVCEPPPPVWEKGHIYRWDYMVEQCVHVWDDGTAVLVTIDKKADAFKATDRQYWEDVTDDQ